MILTTKLIEDGRPPNGAFNLDQLRALGVELPGKGKWPEKGWVARLVGKEVSEEDYALYVSQGAKSPRERRAIKRAAEEPPGLFDVL